jgi:hypothetical protein
MFELSGAHQLPAYADDVNLLSKSTNTIKKNEEALLDAKKEASLQVNAQITKCRACIHVSSPECKKKL